MWSDPTFMKLCPFLKRMYKNSWVIQALLSMLCAITQMSKVCSEFWEIFCLLTQLSLSSYQYFQVRIHKPYCVLSQTLLESCFILHQVSTSVLLRSHLSGADLSVYDLQLESLTSTYPFGLGN